MKTRKRLGALDVQAFMRTHWQRRPLLVRGALPGFADPLSPAEVLTLAGYDEASSRLVRRIGKKWTLEHGPFAAARFKRLPRRDWTVLVQDTNHFSPQADALLSRFDFIPHARIDDVMVSYAMPGGGVGPHVDSYDVFLLQGTGRRRWRVARKPQGAFVPGAPLRILERFEPEDEWVLEAGDMLYLPPGVAHDGIAETECLTWSIGFRAPSDAEVVHGFLDYLRDRLEPEGQYADPGALPAAHAARIPQAMIEHIARVAGTIRWHARDVRDFTGRLLSEPKAGAYFVAPRALSPEAFSARAQRQGVALDPRARLLFSGRMFFLNGEAVEVPAAARAQVRELADRRRLPGPLDATAEFLRLAHAWHARGYIALGGGEP